MPRTEKDSIERLPGVEPSRVVTDELTRLMAMLREICPPEAIITFDFDGRLRVHIDVRNQTDGALVEAKLPALGLGLFHDITQGSTPHHRFFHRVSALVAR